MVNYIVTSNNTLDLFNTELNIYMYLCLIWGVTQANFDRGCRWTTTNPTRNFPPRTKFDTRSYPQGKKYQPEIIQGLFVLFTKFNETDILTQNLSEILKCDRKSAHHIENTALKSAQKCKILTQNLRRLPKHRSGICGTSYQRHNLSYPPPSWSPCSHQSQQCVQILKWSIKAYLIYCMMCNKTRASRNWHCRKGLEP